MIGVVLGVTCGLPGCHVVFSSDDSKNPPIDASGDASRDAQADAVIDGGVGVPNYAFITKAAFTGDLGGIAGANTKCMAAAMNAQPAALPGNFIAVLAVTAPSYSALTLTAGSSGWMRTDKALVAQNPADFTNAGLLRNAIVLDQNGDRTQTTTVWTGMDATGGAIAENCMRFTSVMDMGEFGDTSTLRGTLKAGTIACNTASKLRLLCISVGNQAVISPLPPSPAKRIFLSRTLHSGGANFAIFNATCRAEAQNASLSGAYVALLPSTMLPALSVAGIPDNALFVRVDGTPVGDLSSEPLTFLNQFADSSFPAAGQDVQVWTGGSPNQLPSTAQNCNNWSNDGGTGIIGSATTATVAAYTLTGEPSCTTARHVYCVEQ